jgi:glutaredoxin 3
VPSWRYESEASKATLYQRTNNEFSNSVMPPVTIYTTSLCPYCHAAKRLLKQKAVPFEEIDVSGRPDAREALRVKAGGLTSVPQIWIGDTHVGGCDDLYALDADGGLEPLLNA